MLRSARAWGVLCLLSGHLALLLMQQLDLGPPWLAELTRFLPWYWLLLPCGLALLLAIGLSRWWLAAAVLNLALLGTLTMGLQWHLGTREDAVAGRTLRVLSYNVKALNARFKEEGYSGIDYEVRSHAPDIVALQDAQHLLPLDSPSTPTLSQPLFGLPHVYALDQYVIASRFPVRECRAGQLSKYHALHGEFYLYCQLEIDGHFLSVVTAHLVSPREALEGTRHSLLGGLNDWKSNLRERLGQAQVLLRDVAKLPRPLLLMGDFNAPEGSPVVDLLKRARLRDSYSDAGQGYGYTYGHALGRNTDFLRIDHILLSADIAVIHSTVGGTEASDHSPVIANIRLHE